MPWQVRSTMGAKGACNSIFEVSWAISQKRYCFCRDMKELWLLVQMQVRKKSLGKDILVILWVQWAVMVLLPIFSHRTSAKFSPPAYFWAYSLTCVHKQNGVRSLAVGGRNSYLFTFRLTDLLFSFSFLLSLSFSSLSPFLFL